jgi:glycosyltransferase involved in cell wall biosynthesis
VLVCHMTSVHSRYDVRFFSNECVGLAAAAYDTCLLVADGRGDETKSAVAIRDVGRLASSRLRRMATASRRFLVKCLEIEADLYHFHDPELIPCGLRLKRRGKKVVYDIHEDVPRQLLSKRYLRPAVARLLAWVFERYEDHAERRFDALVAATPHIRARFEKFHRLEVNVNNYPVLDHTSESSSAPWSRKKRQVCYVGKLSAIRGLHEMLEAGRLIGDGTILLAGRFDPQSLEDRLGAEPGEKVEYFGLATETR